MTDERLGDALWPILRRLPPGSGVVFRHHATPAPERRAIFARVRHIARARRLMLLCAGPVLPGADGRHGRVAGAVSWPAHDRAEALAGKRAGAALLFVSPVHPTASHPGAPALGPCKAHRITAGLNLPVIALGGITARRYRRLRPLGFTGWAAIDAWR
jgi:thiamine-phosphate pyrophosphorylase